MEMTICFFLYKSRIVSIKHSLIMYLRKRTSVDSPETASSFDYATKLHLCFPNDCNKFHRRRRPQNYGDSDNNLQSYLPTLT